MSFFPHDRDIIPKLPSLRSTLRRCLHQYIPAAEDTHHNNATLVRQLQKKHTTNVIVMIRPRQIFEQNYSLERSNNYYLEINIGTTSS